jgi:hypothetical protein
MMRSSTRRSPDLIDELQLSLGSQIKSSIPRASSEWDPILSVQDSLPFALVQNLSIYQHSPSLQETSPSLLYRNVQSKIDRTT